MSARIETSDVENLDVEIVSACLVFYDEPYNSTKVLVIADEGNQHKTVIVGDPEMFLLKVQAAIQTANNDAQDAKPEIEPKLQTRCDGEAGCTTSATWLDNKGYAYCEPHGRDRRAGGTPARPLRAWEIEVLKAGEPLHSYTPRTRNEHIRRTIERKVTL